MNRCAVAGFASIGAAREAVSSFSSALARPHVRPARRAPEASAWYSRARDTASWTSKAATGAMTAMNSMPMALPPRSSSSEVRPPPKIAAHCIMWAR